MKLLISTLILSLLSVFTSAQSSNSSVFIAEGSTGSKFVFALQVDKYGGDLYFHLEGPSDHSWVAVGIGNQMTGALMFIAYPGSDGKSVTVSPRIGVGNVEPIYDPDIKLEPAGITGYNAGTGDSNSNTIETDNVCRGCTAWKGGGTIDLTSSAQPFIFAVGPPKDQSPIKTNSLDAGLTEHMLVGHFTMDMRGATVDQIGQAHVPPGPYTYRQSSSSATDVKKTSDPAPHIHGLVMSVVFILAFPTGSLLLRAWNKVKAHAIVQVIGTILFCMAFAGGIVVSKKYNRSKHYNSAHQVIGIILLIGILVQLVLGAWHHRIFKKEQRKSIKGWIHLYLGPFIIFLGLINGGLGFSLAGNGYLAIPYVIIIVIVAIIYSAIRFFAARRRKQNIAYNKEAAREGGEGTYTRPRFGGQHQQAPQQPPEYNEGRGEWRAPYGQDVPLERFKSTRSMRSTRSTRSARSARKGPPVNVQETTSP